MASIAVTVTTKKPDGTVEVFKYEDPVSIMIENILSGKSEPQNRLEAFLSKSGGGSGSGSGPGGGNNQEFFTDDEIEDIWNSVP